MRDPEVLVFGNSRALQFRAEFFKDPGGFYNAGGMQSASDYVRFLDAVPKDARLKVIIVTAEPTFLTSLATKDMGREDTTRFELIRTFLADGWRRFYSDYLDQKFTIAGLLASRQRASIGIAAHVLESGYRSDGSYKNEYVPQDLRLMKIQSQVSDRLKTISSNNNGLGAAFAPHQAQVFEHFLEQAKERGILVIGFIPPIAQGEHDALAEADTPYALAFKEAEKSLKSLFEASEYPLHDVSSLKTLGSSDAELIDNGHGSEKVYARILLVLATAERALRLYVEPGELRALRESASDTEVL
jgi:hypothetical protein